jgi:hypothetical protein
MKFPTVGKFYEGLINSLKKILEGKDPLEEVFADAPIKIAQKSIYSG